MDNMQVILSFLIILLTAIVGGFVWAVIEFIFMILDGKIKIK